MNQIFYTGCVENRLDPLKLGRCQVRVVGIHTENKIELPTFDLPWAHPMMPINSASMNGLGWSPTGVVQGSWVVVIFLDDAQQQPIMLGTLGGIPQTRSAAYVSEVTNGAVTTDVDGELISTTGDVVTELIDSIAEDKVEGVTQETAKKYHINAITVQLSEGTYTTYDIKSNIDDTTISTVAYDENTKKYNATLLNPEQWEDFQYLPFKGTSMSFDTKEQVLNYFETNF